jgi:hydrogenase-4 component F
MIPLLAVAVPFGSAAALAALRNWPRVPWLNLAAAALTFGLAAALPWVEEFPSWMLADPLAVHLAAVTALVGLTGAWANLSSRQAALFQALLGCLMLALLSGNAGVTWMAAEAALLVIVLALRFHAAAAWRVLAIGGVGLALALFGTVLLVAATGSMSWVADSQPDPALLDLAFALLLVGYATVAVVISLHAWPPGATPPLAALSAAFLCVASLVLLRLRGLMDDPAAIEPGGPLMALGLVMLLGAAAGLRGAAMPRLLELAGVGQAGLAALAFGLGGPGATFAGLLHVTAGTLLRAAAFQSAGSAAATRAASLTAMAALLALVGLPPFGLFTSEALVLLAAARLHPALALGAAIGLGAFAWTLANRVPAFCAGTGRTSARDNLPLAGAWLQLAAAAVLGFAMPGSLAGWMRSIAAAIP